MATPKLTLRILPETFGICRLHKDSPIPRWALGPGFFSITRTEDELSLLAPQADLQRYGLPGEARLESGWGCIKVEGPLDFSLVGILAALSGTLARAGVSVFAVSTYDTDYLLIGERELERAVAALSEAGHTVVGGPSGL